MAVTSTPIYPQTIISTIVQLTNSSGTSASTLVTAGTNGTKIESIIVSSTDTSNRDLVININISSTNYQIAMVQIPLTSGTVNNVTSVNILGNAQIPGIARDSNGNAYLYLASGTLLTVAAGSTITSGKVINIFAQGGNY